MSVDQRQADVVTGLRFIRNLLFSGSALSVRAVQAALVVVLLTKALGAESFGTWVQVTATVALLGPILTLGAERVLIRFLAEQPDDRERARLFFGLFIPLLVMSLAGGAAVYFAAPLFDDQIAADPTKVPTVAGLIAAAMIATNVNVFVAEFFRGQLQMRAHATLWILRDVGWVGVVAGLAASGASIEAIVGAYAAWLLLLSAFGLGFVVSRTGLVTPSFAGMRALMRFGGSFAAVHPISWLAKHGNVYFISIVLGTTSVGVYGSVRAVAEGTLLISGVLLMALGPTLVRLYTAGDYAQVRRYMQLAVHAFLLLAGPLVAAVALYAEPILRLFTVPEIAAEGSAVAALLLPAMLMLGVYSVMAEVFSLTKRPGQLLLTNGLMAAAQVAVNITLLSRIGLKASAIGELTAYSMGAAFAFWMARRRLGLGLDLGRTARVAAAVGVAVVVGLLLPRDGWPAVGGLAAFSAAYAAAALAFGAVTRHSIREAVIAASRASGASRSTEAPFP